MKEFLEALGKMDKETLNKAMAKAKEMAQNGEGEKLIENIKNGISGLNFTPQQQQMVERMISDKDMIAKLKNMFDKKG